MTIEKLRMIELTDAEMRACENYADRILAFWEKNDGEGVSGKELNYFRKCEDRVSECMGCRYFGLDPMVALDWNVYTKEQARERKELLYDFKINDGHTRVDVKGVHPNGVLLMYDVEKADRLSKDVFDVLLLVRRQVDFADKKKPKLITKTLGRCVGWVGREEFLRRHLKYDVTMDFLPKGIVKGTPVMRMDGLHRMGAFPGHADDPREHYCLCGEFGSRGGSDGRWLCQRHHELKTGQQASIVASV